jgi:GNAT superfamily N-acetyltransferase
MATYSLRPARPEDAEAVAAIWHDGWRAGHLGHVPEALVAARTPESFRSRAATRMADTAGTVVAVDGTAPVGFVMVAGDEVEQVYVSADHRGGGVAGLLLAEAERLVAAGGHHRAWLAVVAGNTRARRFYERQGWTDVGPFDYRAAGNVTVPSHRYVKEVTAAPR